MVSTPLIVLPDAAARPVAGPPARPHPHEVQLVEFRGLLPSQPAGFLVQLTESERRDVYALLGTFREVRGLVGAGRLLHSYLKEGPLAAARGRITFREFLQEKTEIQEAIFALRQKINRAAEDVCLILPRVPHMIRKELPREKAA